MKKRRLDEIASDLIEALRTGFCRNNPALVAKLLRLLSRGRPLSPGSFETRDVPDFAAFVRQLPGIELDREGKVVGYGLTLKPTRHRFEVDGLDMFTWCAFDPLFFPAILNQSARVQSVCPATGAMVQFTVTTSEVASLAPPKAVVFMVIPPVSEMQCDVRGMFCNRANFFNSREAASGWQREHPRASLLSVYDAHRVGRIVAERLFGE